MAWQSNMLAKGEPVIEMLTRGTELHEFENKKCNIVQIKLQMIITQLF